MPGGVPHGGGDIHLGDITIRGWSSRWADVVGFESKFIHDATVAMAMGVLCFILPVNLKKGETLLNWQQAKEAPWDILLLFGGGFAPRADRRPEPDPSAAGSPTWHWRLPIGPGR